jgi:pyruvate-formate lyase-activating enzyme
MSRRSQASSESLLPVQFVAVHPCVHTNGRGKALYLFMPRCNMRCAYCYNLKVCLDADRSLVSEAEMKQKVKEHRPSWAVLTGGEPLVNPLVQLQRLTEFLKGLGLKVALETNGTFPLKLAELSGCLDYIAVDVKTNESGYRDLCEFRDVTLLEDTLKFLTLERKTKYELVTAVSERTHPEIVLHQMGAFLHARRTLKWVIKPMLPDRDSLRPGFREGPPPETGDLMFAESVLEGFSVKTEVRME